MSRVWDTSQGKKQAEKVTAENLAAEQGGEEDQGGQSLRKSPSCQCWSYAVDTSQSKLVRVWGDQTKHFSCPLRQSQRQQWAFLLGRSTFQPTHSRHSRGKVRVTGWPLSYIFYVGGQEPLKSLRKKKSPTGCYTLVNKGGHRCSGPKPCPSPPVVPQTSSKKCDNLVGAAQSCHYLAK